jgi:NADH:ubiquinone reductase (H+-translocating)
MATGILAEGDIAPPIREILRGQWNAMSILGEVVRIDAKGRDLVVGTFGRRRDVP